MARNARDAVHEDEDGVLTNVRVAAGLASVGIHLSSGGGWGGEGGGGGEGGEVVKSHVLVRDVKARCDVCLPAGAPASSTPFRASWLAPGLHHIRGE